MSILLAKHKNCGLVVKTLTCKDAELISTTKVDYWQSLPGFWFIWAKAECIQDFVQSLKDPLWWWLFYFYLDRFNRKFQRLKHRILWARLSFSRRTILTSVWSFSALLKSLKPQRVKHSEVVARVSRGTCSGGSSSGSGRADGQTGWQPRI